MPFTLLPRLACLLVGACLFCAIASAQVPPAHCTPLDWNNSLERKEWPDFVGCGREETLAWLEARGSRPNIDLRPAPDVAGMITGQLPEARTELGNFEAGLTLSVSAGPGPSVNIETTRPAEMTLRFRVSMDRVTAPNVTYTYDYEIAPNVDDFEFGPRQGTLVFENGNSDLPIDVVAGPDQVVDGARALTLRVLWNGNSVGEATGTILDQPPPPPPPEEIPALPGENVSVAPEEEIPPGNPQSPDYWYLVGAVLLGGILLGGAGLTIRRLRSVRSAKDGDGVTSFPVPEVDCEVADFDCDDDETGPIMFAAPVVVIDVTMAPANVEPPEVLPILEEGRSDE